MANGRQKYSYRLYLHYCRVASAQLLYMYSMFGPLHDSNHDGIVQPNLSLNADYLHYHLFPYQVFGYMYVLYTGVRIVNYMYVVRVCIVQQIYCTSFMCFVHVHTCVSMYMYTIAHPCATLYTLVQPCIPLCTLVCPATAFYHW